MTLLSVQNLTCVQGVKTLFKDISFGIEEGEKIALIGINGCGKSTLLSHIVSHAGQVTPTMFTKQGLKITFLPQMPSFNPEDTILDHLFRVNTPIAKLIHEYHQCLADPSTHDRLSALMGLMDQKQAWDYEARVTSVLNELEIFELGQKMGTLSGGMIKKISLAQVFFEETDLMIMDEPTNHLDIATITWLENMLRRLDCTLLMVTHDRYFLDKICTKILEIDQKTLFVYRGNYQAFLEQKDARLVSQQKTEDSIQAIMRVELQWLRRGPKARSTKQKARKQRYEQLDNREIHTMDEEIELGVSGRRLGKKILEFKSVSKSFGDRRVIDRFSYEFKQGEKIGILGPNGSGKTTLLNMITGRMSADSGEIDAGINTVFGYFDQHSKELNPSLTIFEHVKEIGEYITLHDGTRLSASKLLEKFLFPSTVLKSKIKDLSGGERRRLHLVCMLLSNPNFLLFDEPTNDLDITTLSILEDFLLNFAGCVIIISHDRYFMDRVVDQLLVFGEGGVITHFVGTYSDFVTNEKDLKSRVMSGGTKPTSQSHSVPQASSSKKPFNKAAQQHQRILEKEIEKLELEVATLNEILLSGTVTTKDYVPAAKRLKELTAEIDQKMAVWESLV